MAPNQKAKGTPPDSASEGDRRLLKTEPSLRERERQRVRQTDRKRERQTERQREMID
jgi:hypothetical protein